MRKQYRYERASVRSLLRRLRQYGSYVGCACAPTDGEWCRNDDGCARADYMRAVSALRRLVSTALSKEINGG